MASASAWSRLPWRQLGGVAIALALAGCAAELQRTVEPPRQSDSAVVTHPIAPNAGLDNPAQASADPSLSARAAATAAHLVGARYRYGGTGPDEFDCSGLVYYSFLNAGARVPRTSVEQFRAARPVPLVDARPGDLVFFRLEDKVSHVGIYLGHLQFVHAPSHGGSVEVESLENRYYERHLVGARRLDL
jgi:cell wall-associated NlpC family hydrolase